MVDNRVESTVALGKARDFSVCLMFGWGVVNVEPFRRIPLSCDTRTYSHGRDPKKTLPRDGKMDVGTTRGGSWKVAQWDKLGAA